jgi:hypothetical protein
MAIHLILHQPSRFEHRPAVGWDTNLLESLGILGHPRRSSPRLEHAETAKLDAIALGQFMDNFIEERLNHSLGACVRGARVLSDACDEVPLGCGHDPPPSPIAMIHLCWSEPEASVLRKVMPGKRPCVMSGSLMGQAGNADAAKVGTDRESTCQAQCIGCTDPGRYDLGEGASDWLNHAP